jgi:serine/threonine protein phosphatase PrpC
MLTAGKATIPRRRIFCERFCHLHAHQSGLTLVAIPQQIRLFLNQASPQQDEETNVETHFIGLFDGHAGGRCSNYVAGSLGNTLAEDPSFFNNLPQALKRSFHTTNENFLKVAEKMKYHDGSTGITAVVRDSKVLVANVGDCRCLIISGGRPIQMSIDQKPTNPEEQKRIAALGGTVVYCMGVARVNRVLAVSRAFGNRTLRTVIRPDAEMMQRELTRDDDYIVMASDGLWDVLKNKDVCDMCYSQFTQGNPQAIADELVQSALMRGSMDNVTCIVVKLTDYVARLFSQRAGAGGNANGTLPSASANGTNHQASQQQLFNNNSAGATVPTPLERSSSLKHVPGSNGSHRGAGFDQNGGPNGSLGPNGAGAGGLLPLARQYSTGSIGNGAANGQHPSLQLQASPQLMPVLDNYLYSPNRGRTGSNSDSSGFQLPSTSSAQAGRTSPGIAGLRQHMNREGSFNFEEDEQTVAGGYGANSGGSSASNSGSGVGWLPQPAAASSPVGAGPGSSFGAAASASMPYAARRPNTMGGNAANVLGSRAGFGAGMPNLISMFNHTTPANGHSAGAGASNGSTLAPLSAASPQHSSSSGGGMWNSEGDYSGQSYGSEGSRVGTAHGGFQQRAGALGMFPVNYKKAPQRK